jgi:hypothetical protein
MSMRFGAASAEYDRFLAERGIEYRHPLAQRVLRLCDEISDARGGRVVSKADLGEAIRRADMEAVR